MPITNNIVNEYPFDTFDSEQRLYLSVQLNKTFQWPIL